MWGSILSPWAGVETAMFWPFQQTNGPECWQQSKPFGLIDFQSRNTFFLTNPVQQHTGTKALLLLETLSPINGELGPCRQYWLLLLFCGLRPPPTTSYPTAGITLTSSHAHGGLDRVVFQWKSILQMGSIDQFQHLWYIIPGTLDTCAWNVHLDLKKKRMIFIDLDTWYRED